MRYATYGDNSQFDLAILSTHINTDEMRKAYLDPFGIDPASVIIFSLFQAPGKKKTPAKEIKEYIEHELVPQLNDCAPKYLVCTDAEYFKVLTKTSKVDAQLGYVMDCIFGPWKVVYAPSHRSIFYDPPKVKAKIAQAMEALCDHARGMYQAPGSEVIKYEFYPQGVEEIEHALNQLLEMGVDLASDIEAFSLKHYEAGIGSIAFAWSQHEGIAFLVDYEPIPGATTAPFGRKVHNAPVRALLKNFFTKLTKRLLWHNISYDVYVLIYQLWMNDLIDTDGLLKGMTHMLDPKRWEDTKLITYLATNSCAGNKLSLKDQAQEFAGNYAESEIDDITKIPADKLLRYNLVDACSTWFVYHKHWNTMNADNQRGIYEKEFKEAILDIVQMQLTGMPVYMPRVKEVRTILEEIEQSALDVIQSSPVVQEFTYELNLAWVEEKNATLKKKRVTLADAKEKFNPNSAQQLQALLYGVASGCLCLPILEVTESKLPATDADTLKALVSHAKSNQEKDLIQALIDFKAVNKLLTSFIPAMEAAPQASDGWWYLFGNFNLGGTVSGRLSSSNPNLQNLPANVFMMLSPTMLEKFGEVLKDFIKKGALSLGKLIKSCFMPKPGWLFCGLDFSSLEDRISALTTKDPNKLAVYLYGFDGHCLRAQSYFGENMPDIERAPEGAKCYKALVGDREIYFHEFEIIEYMGEQMTGADLVRRLSQ